MGGVGLVLCNGFLVGETCACFWSMELDLISLKDKCSVQ